MSDQRLTTLCAVAIAARVDAKARAVSVTNFVRSGLLQRKEDNKLRRTPKSEIIAILILSPRNIST